MASIDVKHIKNLASGRWLGIFSQLGISVPLPEGKHGACPICGEGKDRFRLFPDSRDGAWICNQCDPQSGDGFSLLQRALGVPFIETVKKVADMVGYLSDDFKVEKPRKDPSVVLNKVWLDSSPLTGSDMVSMYLRQRGICVIPDDVRICRNCYESDSKKNYVAMVAVIRGKDGKKISIHRTYLEGAQKANIESPKKIMPPTQNLNGCAIRLANTEGSDRLGIAEGIETALSCTQLFKTPTWAVMTTSLMEAFEPPPQFKYITIYADNDLSFAGHKAAYKLAHKLYGKGTKIRVVVPPDIGDFNDVLKKQSNTGSQPIRD